MGVRGNAYPHWGLKLNRVVAEDNGNGVRGNAYPHWGLKPVILDSIRLAGHVRGNAYPHWGLKLSQRAATSFSETFEVMPIPIGD